MFKGYKPQDSSLLTFHMPYLPQYQYSLYSIYSEHLNVSHQEKEV